jgi:hypothetical protein
MDTFGDRLRRTTSGHVRKKSVVRDLREEYTIIGRQTQPQSAPFRYTQSKVRPFSCCWAFGEPCNPMKTKARKIAVFSLNPKHFNNLGSICIRLSSSRGICQAQDVKNSSRLSGFAVAHQRLSKDPRTFVPGDQSYHDSQCATRR